MSHDGFPEAYFCTDSQSDWAGLRVAHARSIVMDTVAC